MQLTIWGASRWDFQYRGLGNTTLQPFVQLEAQILGRANYRAHAPLQFLATSVNNGTWNDTQATMDAEITAALTAGLKYWAFDCYSLGNVTTIVGGTYGWQYYQASSIKNEINWTWNLPLSCCGTTGNYSSQITALVTQFQQTNFQKVLTNRPLLYILYYLTDLNAYWGGVLANFAAFITDLRTATVAAGLGTPYIMVQDATNSIRSTIGADGIYVYATPGSTQLIEPWGTYEPTVEAYWAAMAALTVPMVPTAMMGWDQRSRVAQPPSYEPKNPYFGLNNYAIAPTTSQITTHLTAGVAFLNANVGGVCPAGVGLIYAWNECSECGTPLIPSLGDPTGTRCTAAGAALIGN